MCSMWVGTSLRDATYIYCSHTFFNPKIPILQKIKNKSRITSTVTLDMGRVTFVRARLHSGNTRGIWTWNLSTGRQKRVNMLGTFNFYFSVNARLLPHDILISLHIVAVFNILYRPE